MTPEQLNLLFYDTLVELGWSYMHLARLLKCNEKLVRRWANGDAAIPWAVMDWLSDLAAHHYEHPPPTDWRVR